MSDDFLARFREEPRVEFARELSQRIVGAEAEGAAERRRERRLLGAFGSASVLAAFTFLAMLPTVRAAARGFLDLFRVKTFAAVPVDPQRFARLKEGGLDLKSLVSEQVEMIEPGRGPEAVESPESASDAAGIVVRRPRSLPRGAVFSDVTVSHPGSFRASLDTDKIETLAKAVGVDDAALPQEWNGATLEVHPSPVVALRYHRGDDDFTVLEAKSPEVTLPEGVDIARLGTLGLRIAGMSADEAEIFARKIDWRSTLLVPIPVQGGTFREVEVNGRKGLLVTTFHEGRGPNRFHSMLLWAEGNLVFSVHGPGQGVEILELAQSMG